MGYSSTCSIQYDTYMYILFKEDRELFVKHYKNLMDACNNSDMKFATAHYFNRQIKGVDSSLDWLSLKGIDFCVNEVIRTINESE